LSAGDHDGYYQDFSGALADVAATIRRGWFYRGQHSAYRGAPRGTDPAGVPLERMVVCLENHDQIGNRPFGQRLNHQIEPALFRALSALLLLLPETPLLFMGQEWAASAPFLFFTDHHPELGQLVTEGRRAEFSRFEAFADPMTRDRIPDPQARSTFERSRLDWDEREQTAHAGILDLYRALLALRRTGAGLRPREPFEAVALDEACLVLTGRVGQEALLILVLCVGTSRHADLGRWRAAAPTGRWEVLLTTEEPRFREPGGSAETEGPAIDVDQSLGVTFRRPSAVILRGV
jgi:maltooligosyltrehalose trehalohydrolase